MPWAVIGAFLGVIATALVTFLVAKLKNSGKVDTTEASVLWAEAEKMRTVYREEGERWRLEAVALRTETVALRSETVALRTETLALRQEAVRWREEAVVLREQLRNERVNGGRRKGDTPDDA